MKTEVMKTKTKTVRESDTDSVASSCSSFSFNLKKQQQKGVSPLNRRRSMRIAQKLQLDRDATMREVGNRFNFASAASLRSQNTVTMETPTVLERMETSTKWNWRKQSTLSRQATVAKSALKKAKTVSKRPRHKLLQWRGPNGDKEDEVDARLPGADSEEGNLAVPPLLSKQTTTTGLQLALKKTRLESIRDQSADNTPGTSSGTKTRLKRKATVLKSPSADGPAVKRAGADAPLENPFARKRHRGLKSQKSIVQRAEMYRPPSTTWPVTVSAQVVWTVPLADKDGVPKHCLGVYVDETKCLVADEEGLVLALDEAVTPRHVFRLPSGVKCLLPDGDFLYAGCNDGGIYDISHSVPRLACSIQGFGQILSLGMYQGVAAVSDNLGHIALVDHRGTALWKQKSPGEFGWVVKVDDTGVYHGHSAGVTKYSLQDGSTLWYTKTQGNVLSGVMTPNYLYLATGAQVWKMDKFTGKVSQRYDEGRGQTAAVHCCAVGGGLVFAGGRKLVCYDEESGQVVYVMKLQSKAESMQYFSSRLFCVGRGGLQVLDFTEPTITAAQAGQDVVTYEVAPDPLAPTITPLKRADTQALPTTDTGSNVTIECVQVPDSKGTLKARAVSEGFDKSWDVQLPGELCQAGARYVVNDLRPSQAGEFYRVYGDIRQAEESQPDTKKRKK